MAKNIPNKRPENHQELTKFFAKGIKNNSLKELQGVMNNENYIQGKNLRVFSKNNSSGVERIDGEELKYNYTTENQDRYVCIGSENINNHIMSFWASLDWSKENPTAGIICIDEKIVCNSVKLPFRHIHKLDIAKNENCLGGEIYITDNNLPPMYFSIKDMLDSYTIESNKYFSEFDYTNYTINLRKPTSSNVYYFRSKMLIDGSRLDCLIFLGLECVDIDCLDMWLYSSESTEFVCDLDQQIDISPEMEKIIYYEVLNLAKFGYLTPTDKKNDGSDTQYKIDTAKGQQITPVYRDGDTSQQSQQQYNENSPN